MRKMNTSWLPLLAAVLCLPLLSPPVLAQAAGAADEAAAETLIVGTKQAPPFAIRTENGEWRGMAIELWEEVAAELGLEYELRETDLEGLLTGLEDGTFDASVAALTVTGAREARVDFTHPFHSSGLGIAVPAGGGPSWARMARRLVHPRFLAGIGGLVAVLFATGLLVWLFERRRNAEQFPPGARGLGHAFWWSAVTMTTVGYGDKAPATAGGRTIALVWMFASVITISGFTAAIASALTVASLGAKVQGEDDLRTARVTTVVGSTSERYLEHCCRNVEAFEDLPGAIRAVSDGHADAVVYDEPILRYLSQQREGAGVEVLPETFERQLYAVALPAGSPLREPINRELLRRVADPDWQAVLDRYLGE